MAVLGHPIQQMMWAICCGMIESLSRCFEMRGRVERIQYKMTAILGILILLLTACGQSQETQWQEQYDLGVRYLSEGNYEEATIAFTAAIEIDPKRAEAYLKFADTYISLGDFESALSLLKTGIEKVDTPDDLMQALKKLEMQSEIQWHADLTTEEQNTMNTLMLAFQQDDFELIKTSIRNTALWTLILEHGEKATRMSHYYELDYGNTIDGQGIHISASSSDEHDRSIECYYGDWNYGTLDGEGIYVNYWLPTKSSRWAGTEDWTITHASFSDGLVDGHCERVRYHPVSEQDLDGNWQIKDAITTVSGTTSRGFWHGSVSEHNVTVDDSRRIEGTFENGIVVAVDEDYYGVNYGFDPDSGESTSVGPDDCYYVDSSGYWFVTNPISGTLTTIEDTSSIMSDRADIWKVESLSLQNNYDLIFDYMSQ